jgi:hypothetical protein
MEGILESLPKFSGNVMMLDKIYRRVYDTFASNLPEFFLIFFHRLGGKEILREKRNFGDCKRIFEQAVVEALVLTVKTNVTCVAGGIFAGTREREARNTACPKTTHSEFSGSWVTEHSDWSKC